MANHDFFQSLERQPWLVNTSRGEVVDTSALIHALDGEEYAVQRWMYWKMKDRHTERCRKALFDNLSARDNVILTPHIAGIFLMNHIT